MEALDSLIRTAISIPVSNAESHAGGHGIMFWYTTYHPGLCSFCTFYVSHHQFLYSFARMKVNSAFCVLLELRAAHGFKANEARVVRCSCLAAQRVQIIPSFEHDAPVEKLLTWGFAVLFSNIIPYLDN